MNSIKSNLNNLFLLPRNFPKIEEFPGKIELLLEISPVLSELIVLEQKIQPILCKMEADGLELSRDWFNEGLQEQRENLMRIQSEIESYFPNRSSQVDDSLVESFFLEKQLPLAKSFDHLQQYRVKVD